MKKVLFIATVVKKHINQFHLPYMKKFIELGWSVDVAAKNDFWPRENLSIPYCQHFWDIPFVRNPLSLQNIKAYYMLMDILRREKYNLIICNTPVGGALGRLAAKKISDTKVVYIAHGFHFFRGNKWYKNFVFYNVERFLARYTDCVITINEEDFKAAKKFNLRNSRHVYKIDGIGCNIKRNFGSSGNKKDVFGIKNDDFVVITVAEMIPRKNYITALRAFAKANISNSKYLIVGSGKHKTKLKALTRKLDIEDKVIFLGYREDVLQLLNLADVFLFPTYQEGLGMAIVEAMSAGIPVLVSNVRGSIDCMIPGKSGFAYSPNDVNGFANGLLKISNMTKNEIKKIEEFNKEYSKRFDIDLVLDTMFDIYKKSGVL